MIHFIVLAACLFGTSFGSILAWECYVNRSPSKLAPYYFGLALVALSCALIGYYEIAEKDRLQKLVQAQSEAISYCKEATALCKDLIKTIKDQVSESYPPTASEAGPRSDPENRP